MEQCTEGFEIVRNTKKEVEVTSMILVTSEGTYSCWRGRRKLVAQTWLQAWRDFSKRFEWIVGDLTMMRRTLETDTHGVYPEILSKDPPKISSLCKLRP